MYGKVSIFPFVCGCVFVFFSKPKSICMCGYPFTLTPLSLFALTDEQSAIFASIKLRPRVRFPPLILIPWNEMIINQIFTYFRCIILRRLRRGWGALPQMDATDKPFLSLHAESTITIVPNSSNAFVDAPTGGGTQFRWRTGRTRTRMSNYGCVRVCVSCTIDFSIWSNSFFPFFSLIERTLAQ